MLIKAFTRVYFPTKLACYDTVPRVSGLINIYFNVPRPIAAHYNRNQRSTIIISAQSHRFVTAPRQSRVKPNETPPAQHGIIIKKFAGARTKRRAVRSSSPLPGRRRRRRTVTVIRAILRWPRGEYKNSCHWECLIYDVNSVSALELFRAGV